MTYSFKEIGDAIYNAMLEVKEETSILGGVFNHDVKIEDGISTPAIIITPANGYIEYLDTCKYDNHINYTVNLVDTIHNDNALVEDNMRVVADIIVSKLKSLGSIDWSNNNGATVSCTFNYTRGYANTQEPIRVFQVDCQFRAVES